MYVNHLFFFLLLLYNSEEKPVEIRCPEYCVCDKFENLRRATCQYKKLYSELKLTKLNLLNVSFNKISQIHLYGFNGLDNLKTLDLSFNMIQYFNEQWFLSLGFLQELYLRGNNLQSINYEPRLNLRHLKILDIGTSKIESLDPDIFRNLPNLEVLDISNNFLVYLDVDMVCSLPKLKTLLVEGNSLKCGEVEMKKLRNYTIMHKITYQDSCGVIENSSGNEKFQRMMISDNTAPEKNSWIYDDEEHMTEPKLIEICPEETVDVTKGVVEKTLSNIIDLNPKMFVIVIFIIGILTGLTIGCACQFQGGTKRFSFNVVKGTGYKRSLSVRELSSTSRPRTRSTSSRKIIREDRNILLMHEIKLSVSTPVLTRKSNM